MSQLQDITPQQLEKAAEEFASEYIPMYRKVVKSVFIEVIALAQKIDRNEITLTKKYGN